MWPQRFQKLNEKHAKKAVWKRLLLGQSQFGSTGRCVVAICRLARWLQEHMEEERTMRVLVKLAVGLLGISVLFPAMATTNK